MSLVTEFKKAVTAATKAAAAQDYKTALVQARAARIALVGIPTSELAQEKIEFSRDDLDLLIKDLQTAQSEQELEANGLVSSYPVHYQRERNTIH